jgi:hypothetical protein
MPEIQINYLAVIAAALSQFVLGSFWYGPLFGKTWAAEMGIKMDQKPSISIMIRAFSLTLFGSLLTAFILAHSVLVWRPSVWGVGNDDPAYVYGFTSAFFTWIGFYVAPLFGLVTWEGKSWRLFAIHAAYYFLSLQIMGMTLAYWR